jgi:P pilus assembly chaperone PapD
MKLIQFLCVVVAFIVAIASTADAQISVAPLAYEMGTTKRNTEMFIANNSNSAQEVIIEARYGIPNNLEDGSVGIVFPDSLNGSEQNAAEWIRFFPRRLQLNPGEQQTVRMLVQPPANLPDGEYWSRIVVSQEPISASPDDTTAGLVARLNVRIQTVLGFLYRHGTVSTGIEASVNSVEALADAFVVKFDTRRLGNAAFLGQLDLTLKDANGAIVGNANEIVTVYDPLVYTIRIPLTNPLTGSFTWDANFNTRRTIPDIVIIRSPDVVLSGTANW